MRGQVKHVFSFVAVFIVLMGSGCGQSKVGTNQPYPQRNIVYDNLYQGNSIDEAVTFMGSPEDTREKDIQYLSLRNGLAQGKALAFANRLFNTGRTRSVNDYTSLLSRKMKDLLAANDKQTMLHMQIEKIRQGQAFSVPCEDDFYGKCDAKNVVMFGEIDKKVLEDSKYFFFPEKPTHQFCLWHFHKPNYMIIGEMHYVIEEDGDYKIVVPSSTSEKALEYQKPERIMPVRISGIEKKTVFELGGRSFDQWHIGLTTRDNKNNIIEIVNTSRLIKNDISPEGNETENVVIDYDNFKKYADAWDNMRFIFRVGFENAGKNSLDFGKSGLDYGFSIAAQSKSSVLMYPGTKISNVRLNEKGVFDDGKLELCSFDSTSHDGTLYSNSISVRLTPRKSF